MVAVDPLNRSKNAMNSELAKTISTCAIWLGVTCILTFGFFKMNFDGLLGMLILFSVPAIIGLVALEATKAVWKSGSEPKANPGSVPASESQVPPAPPKS